MAHYGEPYWFFKHKHPNAENLSMGIPRYYLKHFPEIMHSQRGYRGVVEEVDSDFNRSLTMNYTLWELYRANEDQWSFKVEGQGDQSRVIGQCTNRVRIPRLKYYDDECLRTTIESWHASEEEASDQPAKDEEAKV